MKKGRVAGRDDVAAHPWGKVWNGNPGVQQLLGLGVLSNEGWWLCLNILWLLPWFQSSPGKGEGRQQRWRRKGAVTPWVGAEQQGRKEYHKEEFCKITQEKCDGFPVLCYLFPLELLGSAGPRHTCFCKRHWHLETNLDLHPRLFLPHLLHGKTRCFHPPALFAVEGCFEAAFREGYHTFELVCAFAISALGSDFGDFKLLSSRLYRKISCLFWFELELFLNFEIYPFVIKLL